MNNSPVFSIIIPTYNRAVRIGKTIESLLNQDFTSYEIIVVDDGSTDNTEEVVKIFGERIIYIKKENAERAAARNTGTSVAKGKYVNFFDSDDLAYPNHLSEAYSLISANNSPEVVVVAYDYQCPEGKVERSIKFRDRLEDQLVFGNILSCEGVFLRKDIAEMFPFNEDRGLSATEDYELWIRLAARFPFKYSNVITHSVVNHPDRSSFTSSKNKLIERKELFLKYAFEDEVVSRKFSGYKSRITSDCCTYIALHLAMLGAEKSEVFKYLLKSFAVRPMVVTTRRFWGTIKNLV